MPNTRPGLTRWAQRYGLTNLEELALGTDPLSPDNVDDDEDGCTNSRELGNSAILGGRRDAANFWDFFDPNRDRTVSLGDILAVLARFNSAGDPTIDPLSDPPPPPAYHPRFDRGGQDPDGDPWDELPANGSIGLSDFPLGAAPVRPHVRVALGSGA